VRSMLGDVYTGWRRAGVGDRVRDGTRMEMTRGPRTSATATAAHAGGLHWAESDAELQPANGASGLRDREMRGG
jgi:hypothetical protein